jgi:hypothetical protein
MEGDGEVEALAGSIDQVLSEGLKVELLGEEIPPGVALRVVRRLAQQDFEAVCAGRESRILAADPTAGEGSVAKLFERLGLQDLQDVLRHLGRAWKNALKALGGAAGRSVMDADGQAPRTVAVYRRLCLYAFQRAARLDESSLRDLARLTTTEIEDLRDDLAPEDWSHLGLFGGFLSKWFVYGYTYGEKALRLLDLAYWNRECGREVDALFYLTRLLRNRTDLTWMRPVPPTEVSAGVWDVAAPRDGRFFLHSHTDGRIFVTASDGGAVLWDCEPDSEALAAVLRQGQIQLDSGATTALCHQDVGEFRALYRHGPYTRSLCVEDLGGDGYLILFGMRGWHPTDLIDEDHDKLRRHYPRLIALEVLWSPAPSGEAGEERSSRLLGTPSPVRRRHRRNLDLSRSAPAFWGSEGTIFGSLRPTRRRGCPWT